MSDKESKYNFEVLEVDWELLAEHYSREAVVIVSSGLELEAVAKVVADDDTEQLKIWLKKLEVFKPSPEQIEPWSAGVQKFHCLIVQPYVLVQLIVTRESLH